MWNISDLQINKSKHSKIEWMNIYVQGKYVKGSREKNNNPLITRDVLSRGKTKNSA